MESNPGAMLTEIDGLKGRLEEAEETDQIVHLKNLYLEHDSFLAHLKSI